MSYMPQSKSDTHLTPDEVFIEIFNSWGLCEEDFFDPCPANADFDGLLIDWKDLNYVNPPYAKRKGDKNTLLHKFVMKAIEEAELGKISIMLLPSKTDQKWFHELVRRGYGKYWFNHRLKFKNNKWAATQPHFLVRIAKPEYARKTPGFTGRMS